MTVLVTGAAGFVGSQVVRHLVDRGEDVAAMVRPGHPHPRLDGAGGDGRVELVEADLSDHEAVARLLQHHRPEACIHAAWYAEPGKYLPSPLNLESLSASLALLEGLAAAGCRHLVGVGTCFEYAMAGEPLRESSPTRPFTLYAATKLAFMLIATQRAQQLGMGFAWARLFYIYGPFEDGRRLVPQAIQALTAGKEFKTTPGEMVRDYMHIADVAAGLVALSTHRLAGEFNVCSGEPVTIARLMQTLGELLGRSELIRLGAFPPREWDPAYVCGDSRKLRDEAHFTPRYSLPDGLRQTIEWWRERR